MAHILRTLPLDGNSVKYTIYMESLGERNMGKTRRILSDMEIFFNDIQGLTIPSLQHKLNQALSLAEFTDHDWIIIDEEEEQALRLTIIREKSSNPKTKSKEIVNEEKIFKEDKCVICLTNPSNILFCNCGHICVCEECSKTGESLEKCPICKNENTNIRIIE